MKLRAAVFTALTALTALASASSTSTALAAPAADPFSAYLNSAPVADAAISEANSGSGTSAVTMRRFTFPSRGGANSVYAIYAYPQAAGSYPGILMLHGGGSNAEDLAGLVQGYAQRGYAALSVDLPGICGTGNHSSGPWEARPVGEGPRFDVATGTQNSTLADAETAGLEAFNWLRAQAKVNPAAMGITGFSWGGYSTTFLSGLLGDKVKAAYAVFGCGFYEKGSFWKSLIAALPTTDRDTWLATFDAGRRAPGMKAAYFLEGESNDTYFWPEAVSATLAAVPGTKNHTWGPNLNHKQLPAGPAMQRLWFDHHLKGSAGAFATATLVRLEDQADGTRKARIETAWQEGPAAPAGVTIDSVRLWFSPVGGAWTDRVWTAVAAKPGDSAWTAVIPASQAGLTLDVYAVSTDSRSVATASAMRNAGPVGPVTIMRGAAPSVKTSPSYGGGGRRILYPSRPDRSGRGRDALGEIWHQ